MGRISVLLVAIPAISLTSFAQDAESLSRTVFKVSPQHILDNSFKAGVERFYGDHSASIALFLTGMLGDKEENPFQPDGYDGLAAEFQVRKYISPIKPPANQNAVYQQGVYLAGYFQAGAYSGSFKEVQYYTDQNGIAREIAYSLEEELRNWGFGFTIGYQRTLWQLLFLEGFIGGGIRFSNSIHPGQRSRFLRNPTIRDPTYKGFLPRLGLNIGIGI